MTTCPSTFAARRDVIACNLPAGHVGRHQSSNSDWLWWHGNGETCGTCPTCLAQPAAEPTHESEPAT